MARSRIRHRQIALADARRLDPENGAIGRIVTINDTPRDRELGRIAAQTVKQIIMQKIRESERERVYNEYRDRVGELINGVVQRADSKAVVVELGKAEAVMPVREQVPNERYRPQQRLKVLLVEVSASTDKGPQLIVSRAHPDVVRRLFELEVPEVYSGAVELKAIAREAGLRTKVAVAATQDNVDPWIMRRRARRAYPEYRHRTVRREDRRGGVVFGYCDVHHQGAFPREGALREPR